MMSLLNSRSGLVSVTAVWQIAGSASMFGWLLLLPPAQFPGTQEPATVAVQVETKPPVEIASPCQSPDGCPNAGSAPVCSPEHTAKLQELMALRARVGTSIGSAEDFQVALASLFEQEGQPAPNSERQSLPFESGQRPQNATTSNAEPTVPSVQQALPRTPMVAAPSWVQAHNQGQPQYAQYPAHSEQFHPQQPNFSQPAQVPMDGAPVMVSPHVVPNHFTGPNNVPMPVGPVQQFGPPQVGLHHAGPGQWQPLAHQQEPIHSNSQDHVQQMPVVIPPSPQFSPSRSPDSVNHAGPIRISRNDHRPEHENREGVRQQVEPELRHRIQHAARMLEESAWELEQAGEYSLADDVRRQAMELYRRARGNQNR